MNPSNLADQFAKVTYGQTTAEAKAQKICVSCRAPARQFKDEESAQEYEQSGFCQTCQDKIFD